VTPTSPALLPPQQVAAKQLVTFHHRHHTAPLLEPPRAGMGVVNKHFVTARERGQSGEALATKFFYATICTIATAILSIRVAAIASLKSSKRLQQADKTVNTPTATQNLSRAGNILAAQPPLRLQLPLPPLPPCIVTANGSNGVPVLRLAGQGLR